MTVDEMIQEGLLLVRNDPKHNLRRAFRCRLMRAVDALGNGTRRRTKLAIVSVKKVLRLWEAAFPGDDAPHKALALAEATLAGSVYSKEDAEREFRGLWLHCDNVNFNAPQHGPAILVGYAAAKAGWEARSETPSGCDSIADDSLETDVDPYDWDASFDASLAFCGGGPWDEGSDNSKRLEFWTWWAYFGGPVRDLRIGLDRLGHRFAGNIDVADRAIRVSPCRMVADLIDGGYPVQYFSTK